MEEKELKTSKKQRIFIGAIAVVMLGSMIAGYAAIVAGGGKVSPNTNATEQPEVDEAKIAEYEEAYNATEKKFSEATAGDFAKFIQYKSEITAYNETAANTEGVRQKDLLEGDGADLTDDNYLAYYVGWCADESVFDSSFNNKDNPTAFAKALDPSLGMIEGWKTGVSGMKLGGIREITIPGELAYGDKMEICGGMNKPLKFIVMAMPKEDPLKSLAAELDDAYMRLQYAYYGMDYDEVKNIQE